MPIFHPHRVSIRHASPEVGERAREGSARIRTLISSAHTRAIDSRDMSWRACDVPIFRAGIGGNRDAVPHSAHLRSSHRQPLPQQFASFHSAHVHPRPVSRQPSHLSVVPSLPSLLPLLPLPIPLSFSLYFSRPFPRLSHSLSLSSHCLHQ